LNLQAKGFDELQVREPAKRCEQLMQPFRGWTYVPTGQTRTEQVLL